MSEMLSLRGNISGTGDYTLRSDLFYNTTTTFRLPRGLKAKIWAKRLSGQEAQMTINYTNDITVDNPTWVPVSTEYLASAGELTLEKRKPVLLRSIDGKQGFKITRDSGTGDSFAEFDVEIGDE